MKKYDEPGDRRKSSGAKETEENGEHAGSKSSIQKDKRISLLQDKEVVKLLKDGEAQYLKKMEERGW